MRGAYRGAGGGPCQDMVRKVGVCDRSRRRTTRRVERRSVGEARGDDRGCNSSAIRVGEGFRGWDGLSSRGVGTSDGDGRASFLCACFFDFRFGSPHVGSYGVSDSSNF